ncbi:MAG: hypothetical protein AB2693_33885 [Candidatus Thiodiazotropha sp.]
MKLLVISLLSLSDHLKSSGLQCAFFAEKNMKSFSSAKESQIFWQNSASVFCFIVLNGPVLFGSVLFTKEPQEYKGSL